MLVRDADVAIHECFVSVPDMIDKFGFTPQGALAVGTRIHTAPEAFGKMMSVIKPRLAPHRPELACSVV